MSDPRKFLVLSIFLVVIALASSLVHATGFTSVVVCGDPPSGSGTVPAAAPTSGYILTTINRSSAGVNAQTYVYTGDSACRSNTGATYTPITRYTFVGTAVCPVELTQLQCDILSGGNVSETMIYVGVALCSLFGLFFGYYCFGPRRKSIIEVNS